MLSIIIPTYNEKENIEKLIEEISNQLDVDYAYELLFIDDSVDETPALLEKLACVNTKVRYIHREGKGGLASAVVCGFDNARGDIFVVMDADLQHPPSLLPHMVDLIEGGADVVLPSRYINGSANEGLNPVRVLFSKGARLAGKIFLKSMRKISDPMSGYFMIRKSVVEGVALKPIGWKILMEVLVLGKYKSVVEIPYGFEKRNAGESKLSLRVTIEYFIHILYLAVRSEEDRRFYLFGLVGISGLILDMTIFLFLNSTLDLSNNIAASLSACVPIVTNYLLNRNFTWRSTRAEKPLVEFLKYVSTCVIGLIIKNVVVFFISKRSIPGILCNLCGIAGSTTTNYILNNIWVFPDESERVSYTVMDKIKEEPVER